MQTFSMILADDEPQILQGMQHGIPWESLGFTIVATAENGREALEYAENLHPDLLMSDIKMPFMDGLQLAKTLHEQFIHIKIVLFSGFDDFEYARKALSYGVSEYILKPIDMEEVKQLLQRLHAELEAEFHARTDRERQEKIYQKSLPLLRQQFFTQLLLGKMDVDVIGQQAALLDVKLQYPAYSVALISVPGEAADILKKISVQQIVEEMLDKVCVSYSFGLYDKTVYILCLQHADDIRMLWKSLYEAAHMTQRMLCTEFSCGLGSCCKTIDQINLVYRQAKEALEHSIVSNEEAVICYNDIVPFETPDSQDWVRAAEPLERAIRHGDTDQIKEEVSQLLHQIQQHRYAFNEYQLIVLEIIFSLSKLYHKYQITNYADLAGSKKMIMKLLSLRTGEELNNWLYNYCDFTSRAIQARQMDQNTLLATRAREYVDKEFRRPELSVELLCQELHVSASHFSKVFRKETGMSFLSYLTEKRMTEAEHLLVATEYKSRVIGEMVGYPEPNYFSYVFKKNRGVSPARYRKQRKMNEAEPS